MLVIKPDECIDCGVCEPECPIDAIIADTEDGVEKWLEINTKYSEIWPNISEAKKPMPDHEKFKNEENLMRRLAGLLYIDSKTMGDIKLDIQNKQKQ